MNNSSAYSKLKTVIWKNFIIRKHHWILTIFEIATPVVMYIFIAVLMKLVDNKSDIFFPPTPTYVNKQLSQELYNDFSQATKICYASETNFTVKFMRKVQSKLKLNDGAMIPFHNEPALKAYYNVYGLFNLITAVVFKHSEDKQPTRLKYVILPGETSVNWHLTELLDDAQFYIPKSASQSYLASGFIALQMALDTSFIETATAKDLPGALSIQEFPYPSLSKQSSGTLVHGLFSLFTVTGFILICITVVKRIVEEKSTGIKELMKMMGLKSWMLWLGWFLHAFMVNLVAVLIIIFVLKAKIWNKQSVLEYCDTSLLLALLILYIAAAIIFCFAISAFFYRPTTALIVAIIIWLASFNVLAPMVDTSVNMKKSSKLLCALIPNVAVSFGFRNIAIYERKRTKINWKNMFVPGDTTGKYLTIGHVFVMLLVDMAVYLVITLYLDNVFPGPYGLAKPFYFPISYLWNKYSKANNKVENEEEPASKDYCKIEPAPNLKAGIQIRNVYKRYGKATVVNDLSLDIYQEEITALLGHNGAGKTTTMAIITGMTAASSGKVFINNLDIRYNINKVRSSLGLCPQHNLQFTDLTVIEHLKFFGMLKGLSLRKATEEAEKLLRRMNIYVKRHTKATKLSGGMRRKLSLGIALIGHSKVLILDEPTSGLDPESRREIWDMLLTMRGSRTILITTHFMEEADVLGDRIAIMDHGRLMCYGTSMFLKREYGAGYHLIIVRDEKLFSNDPASSGQVAAITAVVQNTVSSAVLQSISGNHLTYLLPHELKPRFGDMFEELENKKQDLSITNITMSVTTLEEVFLRVGAITAQIDDGTSEAADNFVYTTNTTPKCTGRQLLKLQLWSLFRKRWYFAKKKWQILLILILLMFVITFFALRNTSGESNNPASESTQALVFELNKYGKTDVFYGDSGSDPALSKMQKEYHDLVKAQHGKPLRVGSVPNEILRKGLQDMTYYSSLVVAAEFNSSSANKKSLNSMYSNNAYHGAPISLNLLTNAVLKGTMGGDYSISAAISPLEPPTGKTTDLNDRISSMLPLGMLLFVTMFLFFPHVERVSNVKQLQLMCGVRALSYWLVCYAFDFIVYTTSVLVILLFMASCGWLGSSIFVGSKQLGVLLVILLVYGLSAIPFVYLFSYKKTIAGAFSIFLIVSLILIFIAFVFDLLLDTFAMVFDVEYYRNTLDGVIIFLCILPPFGVAYTITQFAKKTESNYAWDKSSLEDKAATCLFQRNSCCDGDSTRQCLEYRSYFGKNTNSINYHILAMILSALLYFAILLLFESNCLRKRWEYCMALLFKSLRKKETGGDGDKTDVEVEAKRISDLLAREKNKNWTSRAQDDLLLVHKLEKYYKRRMVVQGVSFGVKSGDCFGLLGVNGAGKTTTFRILTGDIPLITGESRILTPTKQRIYLSKQSKKYLKQVGYCPQFDAINEVLTGRQMLEHFARLRGMSDQVEEEVNNCMRALGFDEHADKQCGHYSGGTKRKLSIAMALIAGPTLVMLDEPTSGVDPVSRHKMWNTLIALQNQKIKPSIVLSSHSMEECEALCTRLAIMKAGRLECCGTIPDLKNQYGQGFSVLLKVNPILSVTVDDKSQASVRSKSTVADSKVSAESSQSKSAAASTASSRSKSTAADSKMSTASSVSKGTAARRKMSTESNLSKGAPVPSASKASKPETGDPPEVKELMLAFEQKYKGFCTLRDKHVGLLHYHIDDKNLKWGQLFKEIEALQKKYPVIEDYSISETTLEEVFLSIARAEARKE